MSKAKPIEPGVNLSWAQQSPIDLGQSFYTPELPKLTFHYSDKVTGKFEGDHNFHIESRNASITLSGAKPKTYSLVKLHFHAPSEHSYNFVEAPFEVHLVHQADPLSSIYPEAFLVVGIAFANPAKASAKKQTLESAVRSFGFKKKGEEFVFTPDVLLPKDQETYYRYEGSRTTKPFTENVSWIVMRDFNVLDTAVEQHIEEETGESARDLQPLNRRFVLRNFTAALGKQKGHFVGNG